LAATGTTVATANRATKTNGIKNLRMSYLPWFISKSRAYSDSNDWQSQRQGGEDDDLDPMYAVAPLIGFSRCRQLRWLLRKWSIELPDRFLCVRKWWDCAHIWYARTGYIPSPGPGRGTQIPADKSGQL